MLRHVQFWRTAQHICTLSETIPKLDQIEGCGFSIKTAVILHILEIVYLDQCCTKGRSSTAVAQDLGPTATATVAEF